MTITSITPERGSEYPAGTLRITYTSALDAAEDWALFLPGDPRRNTIVYHEIPQGGHDAALWVDIDLETLQIRKAATGSDAM